MFIILLKFAANTSRASDLMAGHNEWIAKGVSDGVFAVVGSLQPKLGGGIIAHGEDRAAIEARVAQDPFVAENVVSAEILELVPGKLDDRLAFLAAA